jgi:hypothetical protein
VGAVAVVALVLVTNECYRHVRGLVDDVSHSKRDIAVLQRELYVLQVQLDNRPAAPAARIDEVAPAPVMLPPPLPLPMRHVPAIADGQSHPKAEPQANVEKKSLVSVALMTDAKGTPGTAEPGVKPPAGPTVDVKLIGEAK